MSPNLHVQFAGDLPRSELNLASHQEGRRGTGMHLAQCNVRIYRKQSHHDQLVENSVGIRTREGLAYEVHYEMGR